MPFTVEVRFEGVCLYVLHTDGDRAMVFMPDARRRPGDDPRFHLGEEDGDVEAEPHVGYVRFNLANLSELPTLDPALPEGVDRPFRDGPEYEVVHRFDHQILHFGDPVTPEPMTVDLAVPDFKTLAVDLELRPEVFQPQQEDRVVLMRASLEGGDLRSVKADGQVANGSRQKWEFTEPFGAPADYKGEFDSSVLWRREVKGDALPVRITDLAGTVQAAFSLRPVAPGGTVKVKVANLCAVNPLEWEEIRQRSTRGPDDDFKWLYRLFRPRHGVEWKEFLKGRRLPAPFRIGNLVSSNNDCMPAHTRMSYPLPGE